MCRHRRLAFRALVTALVGATSIAIAIPAGRITRQTQPAGGLLVPKSGALLGAMLAQVTKPTEKANWARFETASQSKLDLASTVYAWGKTMPTWREPWHLANGRIPMISWGGYDTTAIANGSQDSYIRATALRVKALGATVFLRWFWEMNGTHFASVAGTPAHFKAAWRHIRGIFASVGATNVVWVWSPTAYGFRDGSAAPFYPGASQVDWIAGDGFNGLPLHGGPQQTFASIFARFYAWGTAQGKPLMVAATGSVDVGSPSVKAAWIRAMGTTLHTNYPGIRAVVYFDMPKDTYHDPAIYNWQLDSSPQSMAAWKALAAEPYFRHNAGSPSSMSRQPPVSGAGYWMLGADGRVYPFGAAPQLADAPGPTVAIAPQPGGLGYWVTDAAGAVSGFGSALDLGGSPPLQIGEHVTTIAATPTGNGYWLFTNRGGVFAYGNAHTFGDLRAIPLNGPIVASAPTTTGNGYYMVGSDGGVFSFGDARFHGSTGGMRLNRPVVGISPTPDGRGYWLVASDGGVFAFGAPFRGSMGNVRLNRPVNGLVAYGNGYLMVASDGGVFDFADEAFLGSLAADPPSAPIVGIAATAG